LATWNLRTFNTPGNRHHCAWTERPKDARPSQDHTGSSREASRTT